MRVVVRYKNAPGRHERRKLFLLFSGSERASGWKERITWTAVPIHYIYNEENACQRNRNFRKFTLPLAGRTDMI